MSVSLLSPTDLPYYKIHNSCNDYKNGDCEVNDCVYAGRLVVDVDFFAVEDAFLAEK